MGNRSSRGSVDYYPPFYFPPVPPAHSQMPQPVVSHQRHPNSYRSGSSGSYELVRKRKPWYSFGRRKDKYRSRDLWYQPFVSPQGPVIPPPPGYIYNPATAWGAPHVFLQTVPESAQYGSLQIPGYAAAAPVVPGRVEEQVTGAERRDEYRYRHRHREPQTPVFMPEPEPTMIMPQPQPAPPIDSPEFMTSPPFKPFPPLPPTRTKRPPSPPKNIMALSPYKNTFRELVHPTPHTRAQALEILHNPERTNIQSVRQQWQRQDEEREKLIKEKREQRDRLLNGSIPIAAPIAQTIPIDPRYMKKKKKTRKSLFDSLSSAFRRRGDEIVNPNMMTAAGPQIPSIASVMHRTPSPVPSAHTLAPTPGVVTMPMPVVMPSPFLPDQPERSTTPPFTPHSNFVGMTRINKYADFLPTLLRLDINPSKVDVRSTSTHPYLMWRYSNVKPCSAKSSKKIAD